MNGQEVRARGGERFRDGGGNGGQSFSSSLLDEIYRSIDDGGDKRSGELKFYRQKVLKKQGKTIGKAQSDVEDEEIESLHRALLIERWIEKKVAEKVSAQRRRSLTDAEIKFQLYQHDREEDVLFFSSTSSSSDSSFGGFSSSDTESMYGSKSLTPSCFAKFRPKPVRTSVSAPPPEKTEAKQRQSREKPQSKQSNQFVENKESRDFDENAMIKSKSRALKIYSNLKKVKQPISPGGRLSSFLNSIFTAGTPKKQSNSVTSTGASEDPTTERKSKSGQTSTCSSAASFSRSCLSKNSPCSSEKLRNGDRRTVRFYPVSTIVDEYCRPCGHKSLYEEEPKFQVNDNKAQTAEATTSTAAARKMLTDIQQNKKKNDFLIRNFHHPENDLYEEDEEDDRASCSSSDLFELDHLREKMIGDRYREELPVYETTTRVDANRAIRHC